MKKIEKVNELRKVERIKRQASIVNILKEDGFDIRPELDELFGMVKVASDLLNLEIKINEILDVVDMLIESC